MLEDVRTTAVEVAILEVTVEPSELVVVTSMVVGIVDVDGTSEDDESSDVGVLEALSEVGVLVAGVDVGVSDVSGVDEGVGCCEVVSGVEDGVEDGVVSWVDVCWLEVDMGVEVVVVTPVPACLLSLGSTPSGMASARIWAKPKKSESMATAGFIDSMR